MFMIRNSLASLLAYISGVLLLLSGSTGVATLKRVEELVLSVVSLNIFKFLVTFSIPFLKILFFVMLLFASLGGIAVIIGGIFFAKRNILVGRLFVWIGSGAGIISLLISIFNIIAHEALLFNALFIFAPLGIILAISARIVSRIE